MKIAIIHLGRKGAGPVYTLEMAKALHSLGHQVYYYASSSVENRDIVERQAFQKRFFNTYSSKIQYFLSIITQYKIKRVVNTIKKDDPYVVYSTMNDLWAPFIFSMLKGVIRVKTIHDVGIHEGNNSIFNIWWNRTNFKDAERFIILSKKFIPKLVDRGINVEQIAVIPHAGFDYYAKLGTFHKIDPKNPIVLFFGRIDKYKGINILLQAWPMVLEKHNNAILRIAGNGNIQTELPIIKKYKNSIDLQNRWIKDREVSRLVEDAALVVLPYTHATQSGVIPLAYAFGKPVIATNVGCLDEQVIEGETGFICEASDAIALANTINMMLDNKEMTKEMGQKAYNYMKKYLSWEASAKLFVDLIK